MREMARNTYKEFGSALGGAMAEHDMHQAKATRQHTGNFIGGAIKRPGALHRALDVPQDKKIPAAKIAKATHSKNPRLASEARFAEELKGFRK